MNNTLFIDLVISSWIGSRGITTKQITKIIRESLGRQHSVVLAEARKVDPAQYYELR